MSSRLTFFCFLSTYKPELLKVQDDRRKAKEAQKAENMAKLMKDMKVSQPLPKPAQKTASTDLSTDKPKKRTPEEIFRDLEEQEKAEEQEEYEKGYNEDSDNEVMIDRADHEMYQDLRQEQQRRSGLAGGNRRKAAVENDAMGGRWPAL